MIYMRVKTLKLILFEILCYDVMMLIKILLLFLPCLSPCLSFYLQISVKNTTETSIMVRKLSC